jgi:hypothetical protein
MSGLLIELTSTRYRQKLARVRPSCGHAKCKRVLAQHRHAGRDLCALLDVIRRFTANRFSSPNVAALVETVRMRRTLIARTRPALWSSSHRRRRLARLTRKWTEKNKSS